MMGAIVLSMLLGWFGIVAGLTIWSGGGEETIIEESARTTGGPHAGSDDAQSNF